MTRLTGKYLIQQGFNEATDLDSHREETFYEKQIDHVTFLRIYLGDYPATNPNCGIARLHRKEIRASGVPSDLYGKEEWDEFDKERSRNFGIWCKPKTYNIASGIYDVDRFLALYYGLTGCYLPTDVLPFENVG